MRWVWVSKEDSKALVCEAIDRWRANVSDWKVVCRDLVRFVRSCRFVIVARRAETCERME